MDKAAAHQMWTELLVRGRNLRPTEAVALDLASYFGRSVDDVQKVRDEVNEIAQKQWSQADRSTPAAVRDFYKNASNIVFSGLSFHARQAEGPGGALPIDVVAAIHPSGSAEMLDFGAGVGTAAALFARAGWRVTLAEVSVPLLDFARWRLPQLGIEATYVDLNNEQIGQDRYDLITAFNTMAHVPPSALDETLTTLRNALRDDGLLVFDVDARKRERGQKYHFYVHPHFYEHPNEVLRKIRRLGFTKKSSIRSMFVFQKTDLSPLQRSLYGVFDSVRYGAVATQVEVWIRRMRSHVVRR